MNKVGAPRIDDGIGGMIIRIQRLTVASARLREILMYGNRAPDLVECMFTLEKLLDKERIALERDEDEAKK